MNIVPSRKTSLDRLSSRFLQKPDDYDRMLEQQLRILEKVEERNYSATVS
jgi:hypothetical protein